ncbi:MAG TPA: molybdenum ABC transporter ATP-binding protein [Nitrospirales bacterium]|nr:molybdenum ABC transporter ATP-binding protein [Nitrospirales bacterium]HIC03935.1 molybdenum ABC transporter ATP-binding protein [Nitrospirales bacterium]HIN33376.1 molybdenum ABC transporter ATP-binding protein [Nitrospirales bacterium]HIO69315.1 molybdenum ABC transporter ATP-binding protein [Nitrospirales bacterium]
MNRLEAQFDIDLPHFRLQADINLPGQGVTAIFGPSGSGKTTLLRCLAGLERSATGRVQFEDVVWQDEQQEIFTPPHQRSVGYVFQDPRLFPHLSVESNLRYGFTRTPAAKRYIGWNQVIDLLDLQPLLHRRTHRLSGGEQRRVAIGRAVLASPRLLLMDEPLVGLDAQRKREIIPLIQQLRDELHIPIVYVTHAINEVLQLATTLVLMEGGKTVASGTLSEIFSRLDLDQYLDQDTIGAVLETQIEAHEPEFGLTRIGFNGRHLFVPQQRLPVGHALRVHVLSRDVSIVVGSPPRQTSVLNVFEAKVVEIGTMSHDRHSVDIKLDVGCPLLARITRKSVAVLNLTPGQTVYANVKAVALSHDLPGVP